MEQHIVARNADISAALVVGAQRFQAALLIEPITGGQALDTTERAAFIKGFGLRLRRLTGMLPLMLVS